jgi:GtrA-like protein
MKNFTDYVVEALHLVKADDSIIDFYLKYRSLFNYAVVGGLGVVVNMVVLNFLFNFGLPLLVANGCAILVAFIGNWALSVGPYGYFMDLSKKEEDKT